MRSPRFRIRNVRVLGDHVLELTLTNGMKVLRDFKKFVGQKKMGVLAPLADSKFFSKVKVADFGTLEWPGEIDLCPDVIIWGKKGLISKKAMQSKGLSPRKTAIY